MAGLTNYLEKKVLDHTLGTTAYTKPTSVYIGLFTAAPTDAGGGTEVSTTSTGYARQVATFAAATSSTGSSALSNADVLFPAATATWNTITHVGIFDAVTGGNLLWWGALAASKTINASDQFKLPSGNITVTLD